MDNANHKLTLSFKKDLIRRIGLIKKKKVYIEIFRMIVDNNIPYTLNGNGVFFNLSVIDDDIIAQIAQIVKKYQWIVIIDRIKIYY